MIPISTQVVTENSRYHSCNQEHNADCHERSQRVSHTAIESRTTHTVSRNPQVYKIFRGDKDIRHDSLD